MQKVIYIYPKAKLKKIIYFTTARNVEMQFKQKNYLCNLNSKEKKRKN